MRGGALSVFLATLALTGPAFGQKALALPAGTQGADLGATINAWIAMLPTIGGYKAGTVTIPPGTYTQSTAVVINSPRVSVIGAGAGQVQITCTMNSDCWDLRLNPFVTEPQVGGQIGGFQLIGQSTNPNAVGIHMGDISYLRLEDILVEGFTGANAVGMWWDNINGWTERNNIQRLDLNANTTNLRFTNSGGPATTSFCYNQWLDLRMNVGAGQKGIDFQGGDLCGSTLMMVINGLGDNKTYINITGASQWHDNLYEIKVENDGGVGVRLATAPGTIFNGIGLITNIQGVMTDSIAGNFGLFLPYLNGTFFTSTTSPAQWFTDQFGNLEVGTNVPATASSNFNSPLVALKGTCWNGGGTGFNEWDIQNVLSSGGNSGSTLQFTFVPTSCIAGPQLQVADGTGNGILLSTTTPGMAPRIRHDAEDNLVIDTGGASASLYLNTDNNRPVRLGMGATTGANIPIVAGFTSLAAPSSILSIPGVTSSSHCSLTPTNASAATNGTTTFISAKMADQITITHSPVAGMTYDVLCTPN